MQKNTKKSVRRGKMQRRKPVSNEFPTINMRLNSSIDLTTRNSAYTAYFDRAGTTSATTSVAATSLLDQLLNGTGLLATMDSMVTPIASGSTQRYTSRILIPRIDVRLHVTNALSNGVIAGDAYNTCRVGLFVSGSPYNFATTPPFNTIMEHPNNEDVMKWLCDKNYTTWITAFDATDDGAPKHHMDSFTCPVNLKLDCHSVASRTQWDTKAGDLQIAIVSDSAVTPHPTVEWAIRVYYKVLLRV